MAEHLTTKVSSALPRLGALVVSTGVALLITWLLSFVLEVSFDGQSYRTLFPSRFVFLMLGAVTVCGMAGGFLELYGRLSISIFAYPVLVVLYLGFWWGVITFTAHDYVFTWSKP